MIKKYGPWVGGAFLVFFIATNPKGAANVALAIWSTIGDVASGFATFFGSLVG